MQTTSEYILETSKDYSIYVAQNRAIPSVTDGLKDGQRKAMWLLRNKNEKIKTVSLAGELISSNLYLHGDASASSTISLLAAPFVNNVPLIEGIGAFGTRIAPQSGIGAPRYTYVKKSKAASTLLYVDMNLLPMKENYDGSVMEPVTFLPLIPMVLLNGISGIAVGWSTDILPRSLNDLKKAVIDCLNDKPIKDVPPSYTYLNVNRKQLEDGAWEFTGKIEFVDTSTLRIVELPPETDFEKFKDKLDQMEENGTIVSYEDNSTKNIDILVKFKRGSLKDYNENDYLDLLKLKTRKTERIVVLDWNGKSIRQYSSSAQLIRDFVEWRFKYYVMRYEELLKEKSLELEYILALMDCYEQGLPNEALQLKNKKVIEERTKEITKKRKIGDNEIEKIVMLPIYRWTKEYYEKLKKEEKDLMSEISYIEDLLKHPNKIKKIYIEEVNNA